MVRGTISAEVRDMIARQQGEWSVADIRDMVPGSTPSKVLVVVMRLMDQGLVRRIGYSRGPTGHARPTYMVIGDIHPEAEARDPEAILAELMAGRRYEDAKIRIVKRVVT